VGVAKKRDGPAERLEKYQAMRDFDRTAEPSGAVADEDGRPGAAADGARMYVVQRHRARALHYDFRLEVDGVLASWAVPKGPTLDPKARRLAVHVEDHPIEYAEFEGVIGAGQYGGGDVIVWDRGTWTPVDTDDPAAAIAAGEIHFDLTGERLAGRFVLVRTERGPRARNGKEQWLMLHKNDDHAQPGWSAEDYPESVKTGRTNDEVKAAPEAEWHSDRPADEAEVRLRPDTPVEHWPEVPTWQGPTADELAALDDLGAKGTWEVQGHELALTNLDKVLFPGRDDAEPVTKRDLIRYYAVVAPVILRHLWGRPVNTNRFPNGVDKPGFWHKETPSHAPKWLERWHNDEADRGETEWYTVPDRVATMVWLANFGCVELHPWTSRLPDVHQPTYALFDIDPGKKTSFEEVVLMARLHRTALEHLGVEGLPKVTGQRGIQVWVPVAPGYTFEDTRAWTETISKAVGKMVPELVSWAWTKSDRRGLARLDYTQNVKNKTLVAPYSPRPAPGAPVSVPIEWDELDDPDLRPDRWTIRTVVDRLAEVGDPFDRLVGVEQVLPEL
jgi:bifunctional non-homologous end joining protein LigD